MLGLYGFGRVDLMLEEATGELYVLEANAIPGLTETLLPQAAEPAGSLRRGGRAGATGS